MTWDKMEYIALRLIRRYLFSNKVLEKLGSVIPYYPQNGGLADPQAIVDKYIECAKLYQFTFIGKRLLELGTGLTNSTVYQLIARGCEVAYSVEPYAHFNEKADRRMLQLACEKNNVAPDVMVSKTRRIPDLNLVPDRSIEAVVSNSVLEHVADPLSLFMMLHEKLADDGIMFHIVDYRDHFFKYPYHMLQFSRKTWRRWLDPGDLPGWRLNDHVRMLEEAGFKVACREIKRDMDEFEKVKPYISHDYDCNDPDLSIASCIIVTHRNSGMNKYHLSFTRVNC
jgi:SAM-dependent methyltransferase